VGKFNVCKVPETQKYAKIGTFCSAALETKKDFVANYINECKTHREPHILYANIV
jgi:hypothetical protein